MLLLNKPLSLPSSLRFTFPGGINVTLSFFWSPIKTDKVVSNPQGRRQTILSIGSISLSWHPKIISLSSTNVNIVLREALFRTFEQLKIDSNFMWEDFYN